MPIATERVTASWAESETVTVDAGISVHMCVFIYVNNCYNDSIDTLWSIRQ